VRDRRLAPTWLLPALALAGCFDLSKIDPGPRIVDDFEGGGAPTWTRFQPWSCDTFTGDAPAGGETDGGAGGSVTCTITTPGDGDAHALSADFQLVDPPDGLREHPGAELVSLTSGGTVDLNGFTQLVLFASLVPGTPAPPSGTQLTVEIGCSSFPLDPLASDAVTADLMTGDWVRLPLPLADFQLLNSSHNQACLAQVDSLRFTVVPALTDGQSASGTLLLDNIKLQN
jgi:hypothetical protein